MKLLSFISLLSCFLLCSCPPRSTQQGETTPPEKDVAAETEACGTTAMVQDFAGQDGCGFMFVLNNGDKLLPNDMPILDFKLATNQAVTIDYNIVRDGVSACMMESAIVSVTCITLVGQTGGVKPAKQACVKVDSFSKSKWLQRIAKDMNPYMVTRFSYLTDGWAYLLDNGRQKLLYDCQGNLICTARGKALSECTKTIKNLGEGKVIHATKPPSRK